MPSPDSSNRLDLPFIQASQAQKHVTHNEALQHLDVLTQTVVEAFEAETPPGTPEAGAVWALGAAPTGDWVDQAGMLATWDGLAWRFVQPRTGWRAYGESDNQLRVWSGSSWDVITPELDNLDGIGVNTSHDVTNRVAVSAPATLLSHEGAGHQLKINKALATDTASLLFQTGWSGRAEIGTAGSDGLAVKVSADGSTWHTGLSVDGATGDLHMPQGLQVDGAFTGTAVTQSAEDTSSGRLLKVGDGGLLGDAVQITGSAGLHTRGLGGGSYIAIASATGGLPESSSFWHSLILNKRSGGYLSGFAIRDTANTAAQRIWFGAGGSMTNEIIWTELWHNANTTVDTNGFIKEASPIVRLFDNGTEEPADPVNAGFTRLGTGHYVLSDVDTLACKGWQVEVPQDSNGNRIVFVETTYEAQTRSLSIQCSEVSWNGRWVAGAPKDIPEGRWVDLRFSATVEDLPEL